MCGGNGLIGVAGLRHRGLSPRVRGKRLPAAPAPPHPGSIPACAGETADHALTLRKAEVYPRVCGGNAAGYAG